MSSGVSLEELEARCDMLQRRVLDRAPPTAATRSPPRPTHHSPASQQPSLAPGTALASPPRSAAPPALPSGPSPTDIATAVAALEREKARLENELRVVNTHLQMYAMMRGARNANAGVNVSPPPAPIMAPTTSSHTQLSSTYGGTTQRPITSPVRHRSPGRSSGAAMPSSPSRGATLQRTPVPAPSAGATAGNIAAEQIYEELRQIRRAREEREAQRRAAAVTSPSKFN